MYHTSVLCVIASDGQYFYHIRKRLNTIPDDNSANAPAAAVTLTPVGMQTDRDPPLQCHSTHSLTHPPLSLPTSHKVLVVAEITIVF